MASRPEMREEDETGFCKFFRNLPETNEDTIRIFDRREYFSAHGDDANFIANTVSFARPQIMKTYSTNAGVQDNSRHPKAGTRTRSRFCDHDNHGIP
jgi:hypothetical protein